MINKKTLLSTVLIGAALTPAMTMASGYKINEQSAAGMGTAHAGRAAMAEDASVVFYNPRLQLVLLILVVMVSLKVVVSMVLVHLALLKVTTTVVTI